MKNKKGQIEVVLGIGVVVVFFIALFVLLSGYDSVDANHLGVMNNMGNILGVMQPGWKWTGLFTHVYQYDMRIRKVKVDMLTEQSSATDNTGQAVFGSVSVNYRVKYDPEVVLKLYKQIGEDAQIEDKLNIVAIIKEGYKQATVKHEAMDILANRQQVKEQAIENIRKNFPTDYLEIDQIVVEDIDFTPGFKKAIDEKKIATQNRLKEEENVQVVKFQQAQEIEKSKAVAMQMQLQKAEITPLLVQQKWIEKWSGNLPQYMIVSQDQANYLLQLPNANVTGE